MFRGNADGILIAGPELPEIKYPCLWEHKCLGAKGWRSLERDGVEKATRNTRLRSGSTRLIWTSLRTLRS